MNTSSPTRHSCRRVVFAKPFRLGNSPDLYPPGTYQVETAEAAYEGLERVTYVRTATVLVIPTLSGSIDRVVNPDALDAALAADANGLSA